MFGGDRAARERGDQAYYSLPDSDWLEMSPEVAGELRRLHRLLGLALAELPEAQEASPPAAEAAPAPARLAFRLFEAANRIWAEVAADEQDLRQVITTLRTALAVCWDLYSLREAEQTTVAQLMTRLRSSIEDFERDLAALQAERRGPAEPGR